MGISYQTCASGKLNQYPAISSHVPMISAPIIPTCGHLAMGSQTSAASTAVVVSCCIRGLLISVSLCRLPGIADPKKNHFWNKVVKPIINHPPSHSNHYKWIQMVGLLLDLPHDWDIASFQATETGGRFCGCYALLRMPVRDGWKIVVFLTPNGQI